MPRMKKYKILVVDDSKFNRMIITSMLERDYFLEEACDGRQAVLILEDRAEEFSLILLDIEMPNMNGFEFLRVMKECGWLDFLPVIMIAPEYSAEDIETAYRLGARDIIQLPYNEKVVYHRIANAIAFANRQRELSNALVNEIVHDNETNSAMISILSHIVETRNGESGDHVQNIRTITRMLLEELMRVSDRYTLSKEEMRLICTASSLHDIGKMLVPEAILNKPGKLTDEEFRIMKGHAMAGANMIDDLRQKQNVSPIIQMAYEICRWHHEQYDGRGYPDGLKGDEIPIAAQVVSVADVYDALVSERCYKPAYTPEQALHMILDGQCGVFNPLLLSCLSRIFDRLNKVLSAPDPESLAEGEEEHAQELIEDAVAHLQDDGLIPTEKIMQVLDRERLRFKFFFNEPNPGFYFTVSPPVLCYNVSGMKLFGVDGPIAKLDAGEEPHQKFDLETAKQLRRKLATATNAHPMVKEAITLNLPGEEPRRYWCEMQTIWGSPGAQCFTEVVGRLIPLKGEAAEAVSYDERGMFPEVGSEMTSSEATYLISALKFMVYNVRLIEPATGNIMEIDNSGKICRSDRICYHIWQQNQRCKNCISTKCLAFRREFSKMVMHGHEAFHVIAQYIKVDGTPLVLETLVRITDDDVYGEDGEKLSIASISDMYSDLYLDSVTHVHNRRYYNAKAQGPEKYDALAILNVNNFKDINNRYGFAVGDYVLMRIAETINEEVPKPDVLVRYHGAKFVMMFASIDREALERKLNKICDDLYALSVTGTEDGRHVTVCIGGAMGPDIPAELLRKAEEMLRKAKGNQEVEIWDAETTA